MNIPPNPIPVALNEITPSLYEASLDCLAKVSWYTTLGRSVVSEAPAAILGTAFHETVAAAHRGLIGGDRQIAFDTFDRCAASLYEKSSPLLRLKCPSIDRLPYYHMQRARAVAQAIEIEARRSSWNSASSKDSQSRTERRLTSQDKLVAGRPDHLDSSDAAVVDYKSGLAPDTESSAVSEREARQLRLYAYLSNENGIPVTKGRIVRGDSRECEIEIPNSEAAQEATKARDQLQLYNDKVSIGSGFAELANPSPAACRWCPCIPICIPFWNSIDTEWAVDVGHHVQGTVVEVSGARLQGMDLTTLKLKTKSSTFGSSQAIVEQIPTDWLTCDGSAIPVVDDDVRVVHGRSVVNEPECAVIRPDKISTTIWTVSARDE